MFIVPCSVDHVGATIGRPRREMLRIRQKSMRMRNILLYGRVAERSELK